MFRIASEADLVQAFRPRDRKALELPAGITYPLIVRGTFSWVEPALVRAYVLFQDPGTGRALGLAFKRDAGEGQGGRMCDWCHSWGGSDRIAMLTCEKSSKSRIGAMLCRDLRCQEQVEDAANRSGRNVQEAQRQLLERMWRFANEGLGIQMVPGA